MRLLSPALQTDFPAAASPLKVYAGVLETIVPEA
jgi:hypothetical protein